MSHPPSHLGIRVPNGMHSASLFAAWWLPVPRKMQMMRTPGAERNRVVKKLSNFGVAVPYAPYAQLPSSVPFETL